MRTLHVDTGREMRGGQWQVLRLIRGLHQRGQSPTLLAREDSPLYRRAQSEGLAVRRLTTLGFPQMARQTDLVHAHDARAHTIAAMFPRAPLVVARRVAFPIGRGLLSRTKYRRRAHFIAVSHYVAGVLVKGGVAAEKITVVYDGVPLLKLTQNGSQLVCPASNDPQKGVRLVIEAARVLKRQVFPSSDLERDLAHASVFVYVTYSEGLGSATLLAMSAGVPVVASAVGGLTEVITDGQDGLLVQNTSEDIANAIDRLIQDPSLSLRLAAQARSKVETRFSEARMVDVTEAVYRRVLASA